MANPASPPGTRLVILNTEPPQVDRNWSTNVSAAKDSVSSLGFGIHSVVSSTCGSSVTRCRESVAVVVSSAGDGSVSVDITFPPLAIQPGHRSVSYRDGQVRSRGTRRQRAGSHRPRKISVLVVVVGGGDERWWRICRGLKRDHSPWHTLPAHCVPEHRELNMEQLV